MPDENQLVNKARPYSNHSVFFKKNYTAEERAATLEKVGLNVFFFPSEMITGCDMLSDSGTTTMTNEQWAALFRGDEAYGSNKGYFLLINRIKETFGPEFFNDPTLNKPNAFIFHQGRACEDALFSLLGKTGAGLIIPSNGHFDTTQANIEANNIKAVNLFSEELHNEASNSHFKGNMDIAKLKNLLDEKKEKIPLIYLTITNNTGGGQPVSMANIKEVADLVHHYNIPLFFDACRFAENAWFIHEYEPDWQTKDIKDIVKQMFSYVDGFTISFKKDGLTNMGGGLFLKNNGLFLKKYPTFPDTLLNYQIIKEGHPTYGGLSGRSIMTLVSGLKTVTKQEYLTHRISQVQEFGQTMHEQGLPIVMPVGGHAVYLDINKFFTGTAMKPEDFGGISLTAILLAAYGHRACELGYFAFGSYNKKTKKEIFPEVNYIRFAIPRLKYEKQDLDSVAEAMLLLYKNKDKIPPINVTYGRDLPLRHFKARFEFNE
ncbi:tryptophanase [Patescibacteria group bacterium]|nr:tryptophanase [Patescibacteria group bacterium]